MRRPRGPTRWSSTASFGERPLPPVARAEPTRDELDEALRHYGGKVVEVARYFGKPRSQVYRWLKKYDLDAQAYRD